MVYFLCKASDSGRQNCYFALSLPVRGAWVEIACRVNRACTATMSLPVRGAWVEIGRMISESTSSAGRSPCGERGLKYDYG